MEDDIQAFFEEEVGVTIDAAVTSGQIDPAVASNIDLTKVTVDNFGDVYNRAMEETSVLTGGAPGDTIDDQYWQRREEFAFSGGMPYTPGLSDKGTVGFGTPVDDDYFEDAFGPAGKDMVKHVRDGGVITQEAADHLYASSAHRTETYLKGLRSDPSRRWSEPQHLTVLNTCNPWLLSVNGVL